VAIVLEGRDFLGLITRIDLINYLRRAAERRTPGKNGSTSPPAPSTAASIATPPPGL
jgi:hypothetical protein